MRPDGATVLLLQVDGCHFAVESSQVETLRRKETVFPATAGPPDLLGFLLLGGSAVPILDLRDRLGLPGGSGRSLGGLLVVPPREVSPLAFRVDRVEGPVHLPWRELASLPVLLQQLQQRRIVWGLICRGEEVIPLIDLAQVVSPEESAELLHLAHERCA